MSDTSGTRSPVVVWAGRFGVIGGCLSLLTGAIVTTSVTGRWLADSGVPGDFEFVQMATAVSIFFFLVACQGRRGNIIVDSFTGFLSDRARNRLDAFWDGVYGLAMAAIGVCMVSGTLDALKSGTGTMVLQLPLWPALLVCTVLLFVLAGTCFWTARQLLKVRA